MERLSKGSSDWVYSSDKLIRLCLFPFNVIAYQIPQIGFD